MIAITGAAGFIGSNLAQTVAAKAQDLLLVDHALTADKAFNFVGLRRFRFLEHLDFLSDLEADRIKPEVIFHLGACSSTTETNWDYLKRNNIEYTQRLWTWCAFHNVPFIYASSAATYGDGSRGFDDRTPASELTPLNLYGKSKNDFDIWAQAEVAQGHAAPPRWAGLKFFNVYGPRETHKGRMASIVFQTYLQIQQTGAMKLFRSTHPDFADGKQLRDFVYVGDCVQHMLWLWQNPHRGGIFNSGTGKARSFWDLATAVFAARRLTPNISFTDMPADLAKQYQNFTQASMSQLRELGCDTRVTSLESGVSSYVAWLDAHYPANRRAA